MRTVVRFAALLQFLARKSFKLDFGIPPPPILSILENEPYSRRSSSSWR
jgi:hypothetical protein